jgi:hypothetical protein
MNTTSYIEPRHRTGSGVTMAGTLLMLVITGFMAWGIYALESTPILGSPSNHLDGYFAVAVVAWVVAAGGALWLWGNPIRGPLHHTQLLVPWCMLGIWAAVATGVDDVEPPSPRSPQYGIGSATVEIRIGKDAVTSPTRQLRPGTEVLGIRNATNTGWMVAVLIASTPFDEADIAAISRDSQRCTTGPSPNLAEGPCVSRYVWVGPSGGARVNVDFNVGYYAIAVRAPESEFAESGITPVFFTISK